MARSRASPAIELGTLALVFLAPLSTRALGLRPALWATAGGVAVVRLAMQLVSDPFGRLLLVLVGVVLLLWFVPVYLLRWPSGAGWTVRAGPTGRVGYRHGVTWCMGQPGPRLDDQCVDGHGDRRVGRGRTPGGVASWTRGGSGI